MSYKIENIDLDHVTRYPIVYTKTEVYVCGDYRVLMYDDKTFIPCYKLDDYCGMQVANLFQMHGFRIHFNDKETAIEFINRWILLNDL